MKIIQVNPGCGIPIPPPSWGAIEKIVWEFLCNTKKLGHETELKWCNDIKKEDDEYPNPNISIAQAEGLVSRAFNLLKKDLESEDKALEEFKGVIAEYLEKYNIYVSYTTR